MSNEEMSDTKDIIDKEVLRYIREGYIKNSKQLDKRLSELGFMRIPLDQWQENRKGEINYHNNQIGFLRDKYEGFMLFIFGVLLGYSGSVYSNNRINWLVFFVSLFGFVFGGIYIYNIHKKIKSIKFIKKEFIPYIIVSSVEELEKFF